MLQRLCDSIDSSFDHIERWFDSDSYEAFAEVFTGISLAVYMLATLVLLAW